MLCFRKFLIAKMFMDKREGEVSSFFSKNFRPTVPKKFIGGPRRESLISGIGKCDASEGYVTIFRRKYIVSKHQNTS